MSFLEEAGHRKSSLNLKDLDLQEMTQLVRTLNQPDYRARQIMEWLFRHGVTELAAMTNLPLSLRQQLAEIAHPGVAEVVARWQAADGTTKYLLRLSDGETVECVYMLYSYGATACVSSQVGCRMGCLFCASTIGGKVRDLTCGEMYEQVLVMNRDQKKKVNRVVVMGIGEPLENYDETLKFIRLLHEPYALNIGYRHVTISTCGLVPGIKRLAREGIPLTLAVSLHAPNDELRNKIMPINRQYPLAQLLAACREYAEITHRRVTFEYVLIKGLNDSAECARELARLLRGMLCHVNLIPVNYVPERGLEKPEPQVIAAFQRLLAEAGIPVTLRRELGSEIMAACGQLRRSHNTR